MRTIPLWAHRGYSGRYPENTMAAFIAGVEAGASGIECDLRETSDGHLVILHDATVDRTTDGVGAIEDMTLDEARRLDAGIGFHPAFTGACIPTLEEFLAYMSYVASPCLINLEWKLPAPRPAVVQNAFQRIEAYGLASFILHSSFHVESLRRVKQANPHARTALLVDEVDAGTIDQTVALGAEAIHPNYHQVTPNFVRRAHQQGLRVNPFTVNDARGFAWMYECNVDAVITNWPAAQWWKQIESASDPTI
ncbi:glycerophosphodiester phosphodiesterase [Alicyclobacillus fodiniaquatilis]|uniref:Glycerophosphodiester phosphodiesterase n=1 Tax=Alicyclobacillus fodiniaquatilis TaxID=1661150 RepID=A0ABW4JM57_9BACL